MSECPGCGKEWCGPEELEAPPKIRGLKALEKLQRLCWEAGGQLLAINVDLPAKAGTARSVDLIETDFGTVQIRRVG